MLLCGMVVQASTGLTDYSGMLVADLPTHGDASEALQALIDECPNMTIYIPAGTYTLYNPIRTSAVPTRTVALQLDDNAVLKAAGGWNHSAPMITLGTSREYNTTAEAGYFYYFDGGTIDCSGVAEGIAVECGRNIQVRNINIINTKLGFNIKNGTNGGSSDADIFNLNIVGNGKSGSVGMKCAGYDNIFANIKISNCQTGMYFNGGGVNCRDFDISLDNPEIMEGSVAVECQSTDNWFVNFNITDYQQAFRMQPNWNGRPVIDNLTVDWTRSGERRHEVFSFPNGGFNAEARNIIVKFNQNNNATYNRILTEKTHDGEGSITNLVIEDPSLVTGTYHQQYIVESNPIYLDMARQHGRKSTHAASVPFPGKTVVAELGSSDYVDVAAQLQKIIDENPGATIYIPDGEYQIKRTIRTSSEPGKNVSLRLANFAVFSPNRSFTGQYLFDLGSKGNVAGAAPTNFEGGTLIGSGNVNAMQISSGSNSVLRYTVMLSCKQALHIGEKAEGTEVLGVNIEGLYSPDCVGVVIDAPNCTFNMMRINDVHHGMHFRSSGNIARNIHPLTYNRRETWEGTCAVIDEVGGNYYDYYYPDHFSIGYYFKSGCNVVNNGFCYHYTPVTGGNYSYFIVKTDGPFESFVGNIRADFTQKCDINGILNAGADGGSGLFFNTFINNPQNLTDYTHGDYDGTEFTSGSTPYKGEKPVLGGKYYLYNVNTGLFVDANSVNRDQKSSAAILSPEGIEFEVRRPDGIKGVELYGAFENLGSINVKDGAMLMDLTEGDAARTDFALTSIRTSKNQNVYTLSVRAANNAGCGVTSDSYLVAGGADKDLFGRYLSLNAKATGGSWQFVSREERLAHMQAEAKLNPGGVDASWLIPGRGMNENDTRLDECWSGESDWGSISGYNGWRVMEWWDSDLVHRETTLTGLPAGTYEYYIEGYNRDGNVWASGNTTGPYENLGWYYAGKNGRQALNVFEDARPFKETGWEEQINNLWFPAGHNFAANAFHKEGYRNAPVAANVGADGNLTVGICKYAGIPEDSFELGRMYLRYRSSTTPVDLSPLKKWAQTAINNAKPYKSDSQVAELMGKLTAYFGNASTDNFNVLAKAIYALNQRVDDLITGGVDGVIADAEEPGETRIYNLQGIRLDRADTPGIYIINGRKVVVR